MAGKREHREVCLLIDAVGGKKKEKISTEYVEGTLRTIPNVTGSTLCVINTPSVYVHVTDSCVSLPEPQQDSNICTNSS